MAKVTNTLIANITCTEDSTQNVIINRSTGNPAFDASGATCTEYMILSALPTGIALPLAITTQVYIKNLDTSGHTILVNWTVNGGAARDIMTLLPGDQIIYWAIPGGGGTGITALTLTASLATTLVEFFLGG